jgi:hypothetical protein
VIKFVSDLRQAGGVSPVSSTNKSDRQDITEILLKVVLNTITHYLRNFRTPQGDDFTELPTHCNDFLLGMSMGQY